MPEPIDYFEGKRKDRIYISRAVEIDKPFEGGPGRDARYITLDDSSKETLDDDVLDDLFISGDEKRKFLVGNIDILSEIVSSNVTSHDVVALAYRREQLGLFESMLKDSTFIENRANELGIRGKEAVWQRFFEDNPWIFGYGLNYVFMSELDDKKLEQITTGAYLSSPGKIIDALMKTRGFISSLCFVEIKTNETKLLDERKPYRSGSWKISGELAGSVAQIQRTLQLALEIIHSKYESTSKHGDPSGEIVFLYQPKAYVVVGSLEQFMMESGINEEKYCSFELFRQNLNNPEIITFDELFSRAHFIVEHSGHESKSNIEGESTWSEDDIHF